MSSVRFPAVRARWTREILRETRALPHPHVDRILGHLEAADLRKIEGAAAYDWLPIEVDLRLVRSAYEQLGPSMFVALVRRAAHENLRSPLLRALAMGARMLGRNALMVVLPRGWHILVRNCGRVHVTRDARRRITFVELLDVPSPIREEKAFQLGIAGALAACMDFGGYVGQVRPEPLVDDVIRYRLTVVETTIDHDG
jgi:hypothetical protein